MNKTDLIIIGAGPGGYEMAVAAAGRGLTVTLFEENCIGGTCLNEGCIPTKALSRNAEVVQTMRHAEEFGIPMSTALNTEGGWINMDVVQKRKHAVVEQLAAGIKTLLDNPRIAVVNAHAEFLDAKTVVADGVAYTADNIVIATGSESSMLPVEGIDLPRVMTSRELLCIDYVPKRLCVIGAGVIGVEFASIFSRFGSEVTMIEYAKEILPPFDKDIAKRLRQVFVKSGITVNTGAAVTRIERREDFLQVFYEQKGKTMTVDADVVLVAVGRSACTDGLNLVSAGVDVSRVVDVDDNMQTNVEGIYAIGDVNGRQMLAHAATFQGFRALHHILGEKDEIRLDIIPAAVFCHPEVAMVGMTEEECKECGKEIAVGKSFFRANGKALSMGETEGYCKLIAERESGRILGCHIFGAHSADLVQEVAVLMNMDGTAEQLAQTIHGHPTLGEVILSAARKI